LGAVRLNLSVHGHGIQREITNAQVAERSNRMRFVVIGLLSTAPGMTAASSPPIDLSDVLLTTLVFFPWNLFYVPLLLVGPAYVLRGAWNMFIGDRNDYRYIGGTYWGRTLIISCILAVVPLCIIVALLAAS
jgi:hypothetical protein